MNEYVNYKQYVSRQEGLNEAEFAAFPKKNEYPGTDALEPQISPTARPTPIIGVSIRGSSTGGLPSGADQQGDISPTKVGGYDRVQPQNLNSKLVDKTPNNAEIGQENVPINDSPSTSGGVTHPHQIQVTAHEEPQATTGASTDSDPTLKLKSASPKGIDVDITEKDGPEGEAATDTMQNKQENQMIPATSLSETFARHKKLMREKLGISELVECHWCHNKFNYGNVNEVAMGAVKCPNCDAILDQEGTVLSEGKHKAGCKCGFCMNKTRFGKKKETDEETNKEEKKPTKEEKKLDETFNRHIVLMKEYMAKKCPCGCEPDKCKCPSDCPKCDCNKEAVDECDTCGCGDPSDTHDDASYGGGKHQKGLDKQSQEVDANIAKMTKDKNYRPSPFDKDKKTGLNESYSAPFARMRSMAGLGNTILLSNGLMETKHQPGADHPFTTHWEMDKEKAGYVKVDEEKLKKVKAMLERKSKRGSLSETEFKLAKRLEEVLKKRRLNEESDLSKETGKNPSPIKCTKCGKTFTPSYGEYSRCQSCLANDTSSGEKATGTQ